MTVRAAIAMQALVEEGLAEGALGVVDADGVET